MTYTMQRASSDIADMLRESLSINLATCSGDRAPLELNDSVRQAPDDDVRQSIVLWAAERGYDLLDFAADRPSPVIRIDDVGSVFRDEWRQGRTLSGLDDESDVPLQAWLLHREIAERLRNKLISRVITYDNDAILEAQRLLRASMAECGVDDDGLIQLPGRMNPVTINLTISTGDSA